MDKHCTNEECRKTGDVCAYYQKVIHELNVKVKQQKKTLDDYKHLNMKSFDDITQLESDIRDKEEFINKIRKERNDLKKEVKFLNEKIELKNEDIMKMQVDFENYNKTSKASKKTLEEEKEQLKKEHDEIQNNLKNEIDIEKLKEKRMLGEIRLLESEIDDLKRVNSEKEIQLIELVRENNEISDKNEALKRSNIEHDKHVVNVHDKSKQTQNSLADELELCDEMYLDMKKFICNICEKKFDEKKFVNKHIKDVHVKEEEAKLLDLEKRLSSQLLALTNSIHKIMEQEVSQKDKPCNCHRGASRTFCIINHGKHNWKKSESQYFIAKLKGVKKSVIKKEGESREAEEADHPVQKGGVS